jgi:hypothetical protein
MKKAWDWLYIAYLLYVICAYIHSNPLLEAKLWLWFATKCQNSARLLGEVGMGAEIIAYEVVKS